MGIFKYVGDFFIICRGICDGDKRWGNIYNGRFGGNEL